MPSFIDHLQDSILRQFKFGVLASENSNDVCQEDDLYETGTYPTSPSSIVLLLNFRCSGSTPPGHLSRIQFSLEPVPGASRLPVKGRVSLGRSIFIHFHPFSHFVLDSMSADFVEFLECIGVKTRVGGTEYAGGLTDADYFYSTKFCGNDIAFHVSPLITSQPDDPSRKRHIGYVLVHSHHLVPGFSASLSDPSSRSTASAQVVPACLCLCDFSLSCRGSVPP